MCFQHWMLGNNFLEYSAPRFQILMFRGKNYAFYCMVYEHPHLVHTYLGVQYYFLAGDPVQ